ncbi:MAG: helix-hairpin-helix domain-containing protein [Ruminiclostridium sp.]|jgi:competence ComEA-like helix-hairpin-helix protein|nr:helix-hairpin-helix domain-containing protein [Ruminiclostridium sp.]MCI9465902.1 helix-hairpin-helix domain-containing protein [Ruminiclostridium sp.]
MGGWWMGRKNRKPSPFACLVLLFTALFALLCLLRWSQAPASPTVVVPQFPGAEPWQLETVDAPGMLEGEVLDLNTASQGDLSRLPGIGEKRAADIVAWREAQGGFPTPEGVLEVPGIGPGIFARIQAYITVSPLGERGGSHGADFGG